MKWLKQQEFWHHFEKVNPVRIDYTNWCYFKISESKVRAHIGSTLPNDNLLGEDDPPGPVLRWYGELEGIPILLDFHPLHPHGEVVILYYGDVVGARDSVWDYFKSWGHDWLESASE